MKKKITLTLEAEVVDWLKKEQVNISAWVRAIIMNKYTENRINKIEIPEEIKEVFDGSSA